MNGSDSILEDALCLVKRQLDQALSVASISGYRIIDAPLAVVRVFMHMNAHYPFVPYCRWAGLPEQIWAVLDEVAPSVEQLVNRISDRKRVTLDRFLDRFSERSSIWTDVDRIAWSHLLNDLHSSSDYQLLDSPFDFVTQGML